MLMHADHFGGMNHFRGVSGDFMFGKQRTKNCFITDKQ